MIATRICPRHQVIVAQPSPVELEAELAPLEFSIPGFQSRIPPVTKAELDSMDRQRHIAATQSEATAAVPESEGLL